MDCPNCRGPMSTQTVEAQGAITRPIAIDACPGCSLFWFDTTEDLRLTAKSVVDLFRYIGAAAGERSGSPSALRASGLVRPRVAARPPEGGPCFFPTSGGPAGSLPLASNVACPRCRRTLGFTHDQTRTTRFTYWRCMDGHGKLITFTQFLAEKDFLRPPSPDELARLRASVQQIVCSQCGAPVDLRTSSACTHCGAPITMLDPDSVAKALQELDRRDPAPATPSGATLGTRLSDAQIDALFDAERIAQRHERSDLVAIGAAAVGALLGNWLSSS